MMMPRTAVLFSFLFLSSMAHNACHPWHVRATKKEKKESTKESHERSEGMLTFRLRSGAKPRWSTRIKEKLAVGASPHTPARYNAALRSAREGYRNFANAVFCERLLLPSSGFKYAIYSDGRSCL